MSSRWEPKYQYGDFSSSSHRSQLHRNSFSSSTSACRVGSGRFINYHRDISDSIFSSLNSPSESFRLPHWTPLPQGAGVGDVAVAAAESLARTSASTTAKEVGVQTGFSTVLDIPDSVRCTREVAPMAAKSHCSSLRRNFSSSYSLSNLGSRRLFCRQNSDSRICLKSGGSNESTPLEVGQGSQGNENQQAGVTDWSMHNFSQLVTSSRREDFVGSDASCLANVGWIANEDGLDQGFPSLSMERIRVAPSQAVSSHTESSKFQGDLQTCGLCSRWLLHRSPWSSHRMLGNNDLPVVGVLVCGHVYHADCLEKAVPDTLKHDPPCPQCDQTEITKLKAAVQTLGDSVKCTGEPFMNKLSKISPQFQIRSFMNAKSSLSVMIDETNGAVSTPVPTGERGFFPRSLSKRQFSFGGKSYAQSLNSKKSSSVAQVSPENQTLEDLS